MTYKEYVKNAKRAVKHTGYAQAVCFDTIFKDFVILHFPTEVKASHIILGIADYNRFDIVYTEQNI